MPQRFLRPGIRTSPRWNAISHKACRLYISIVTQVDDYGRYDGRNSILWSDAFAVWNEQNPQLAVTAQESAALCIELVQARLAYFYEANGRRYIQIEQWQERTRGDSKWPDPSKSKQVDIKSLIESAGIRSGAQENGFLPQPIPASIAIAISHEPSPSHQLVVDEKTDFEKFWEVYPRKVGKQEALKVFDRIKKKRPPIEKILAAIEAQKKTHDWTKDDGQFIPHPSTWLNRGSWDDDVEIKTNGHPVKNLNEWPLDKRFTVDNQPRREQFASEDAFNVQFKLYTQWRNQRLTDKQKTV